MYLFPLTSFAGSSLLKDHMETCFVCKKAKIECLLGGHTMDDLWGLNRFPRYRTPTLSRRKCISKSLVKICIVVLGLEEF